MALLYSFDESLVGECPETNERLPSKLRGNHYADPVYSARVCVQRPRMSGMWEGNQLYGHAGRKFRIFCGGSRFVLAKTIRA